MCIALPPPRNRYQAAPPWWRRLSASAWRLSLAAAGLQALMIACAWGLGAAPSLPVVVTLAATLGTGRAMETLPSRWRHDPPPYPTRVAAPALTTLGLALGLLPLTGMDLAAALAVGGGLGLALRGLWWMRRWSLARPPVAEAGFLAATALTGLAGLSWVL